MTEPLDLDAIDRWKPGIFRTDNNDSGRAMMHKSPDGVWLAESDCLALVERVREAEARMSEPLDLDALAALEAAATPGPWQVERGGDDQDLPGFREGLYVSSRAAVEQDDPPLTGPLHNPHDAWFLVEARNALPALIERVRVAEARIAAVEALCDDFGTDDGAAQDFRDGIYAALGGA